MTSAAEPIARRLPLRTLRGDYPNTHALRHGRLASPVVALEFADMAVPNKAEQIVRRRHHSRSQRRLGTAASFHLHDGQP